MFSPYYAWRGWADPLEHCAVNVAIYGPRGARWAMTERGRASVTRDADVLSVGPSALRWERDGLTIDIDEIANPLPRRIRGRIRLEPSGVNASGFALTPDGAHMWRPISPRARVSVDLRDPSLRWSGDGYFDTNAGSEPLEKGFSGWSWSRAALGQGAAIFYDAERRNGAAISMALRFRPDASYEKLAAPPVTPLPKTKWRIARATRSDDGVAALRTSFEDTPFYARAGVDAKIFGERAIQMHEVLSLDRFANPVVRLMLPFRMPRR